MAKPIWTCHGIRVPLHGTELVSDYPRSGIPRKVVLPYVMSLRIGSLFAWALASVLAAGCSSSSSDESCSAICENLGAVSVPIVVAPNSPRIAAIDVTTPLNVLAGEPPRCQVVWNQGESPDQAAPCSSLDGGLCWRHYDCPLTVDGGDGVLGCDKAWLSLFAVWSGCNASLVSVTGERQSVDVSEVTGGSYLCHDEYDCHRRVEVNVQPSWIVVQFGSSDAGIRVYGDSAGLDVALDQRI